jgi:hypothetical protein
MMWDERIRTSYPLSVKRGNVSHHIIFWSLETLIGLRVWEKGINWINERY